MGMRITVALLMSLCVTLLAAETVEPRPNVPAAGKDQQLFTDAEWTHVQAQGQQTGQVSSSGIAGRAIIGLLVSVVLIIAVAALLAYAVKRWGGRRTLPGRGRHLEVIETVPLSFKRSLSLVRIGDQLLVVGQGDHELHHLALLPASVLGQPAAPVPPAQPTDPAASSSSPAFAATLANLMGKRP
jgi:flagellar biosynthetic protein FliO